MGLRGLVVILSFLGATSCARGETPPASPDAPVPTPAPADVINAAPTPARPEPRTARQRVPLLERHGDTSGPVPYRVVEPGQPRPTTPLIIALHGRGDSAEGFARTAMRLGLDARVFVCDAPLPFGLSGGRQWFDADSAERTAQVRQRAADVVALVDKLTALYPEAGKPALYGFSQGAVVAFQVALEHPERVRAVAALSGFLESADVPRAPSSTVPLPLLVTAGTKDGIIPQDRSWAAADVFDKLGGYALKRFVFEGPHAIPPVVIDQLAAFLETAE